MTFPFLPVRLFLPIALAALLCIAAAARTADGQTAVATVVPGVGVAGINLGATPEAVAKMLGPPAAKISFADEKQQWENFRYDLSKELPFVQGFDELWTYQPTITGSSQAPIWKIYFKDRKANFIVVSDFIFKNGRAAAQDGVGLGSSSAQVRKVFTGGSARSDPGGSDNLVYDDRGVTFVLQEDRVRVIQIYRRR